MSRLRPWFGGGPKLMWSWRFRYRSAVPGGRERCLSIGMNLRLMTKGFQRIKKLAEKEIATTRRMVHRYRLCGDQSLPVRRIRLCAWGGGWVTRKSSCCDSLCATRASASRRTRYACSFWFTARFAKQHADVYTENLSPSVLRGVHVLIADNSATDHEFLTTQMTSSWGNAPTKAQSGPTSSMSSTIRWIVSVQTPPPSGGMLGGGKCRYANHSSLWLPLRSTRTTPSALMTSKGSR